MSSVIIYLDLQVLQPVRDRGAFARVNLFLLMLSLPSSMLAVVVVRQLRQTRAALEMVSNHLENSHI